MTRVAVVTALFSATALAGVLEGRDRPVLPASPNVEMRTAAIRLGFAEVVRFGRAVDTIVVGDADILDAAVIDEETVVLTALAIGRTNVVVLGQEGQVLSRFAVTVRAPRPPTAEIYRGTERSVLVCDPDCLPSAAGTAAPVEP